MPAREMHSTRLGVRVTPRANHPCVCIDAAGTVQVRVTAAPVDGAANDAVIRVVAEALSLPKSRIRIDRGRTSRYKQIVVELSEAEVLRRLETCG
jgi:uncharacterized protein YggU (UPF0235/DUF167 family)